MAAIVLQQQNKTKIVDIFKILSFRRLSIQIDLGLRFTHFLCPCCYGRTLLRKTTHSQ